MPNENEERPRQRRSWADFFAVRSTVDIMILAFTFLVTSVILLTGATVAVIEVVHPESDTTSVIEALMTIVTGIVGALLGLIAGKSEPTSKPPES